MKSKKYFAEITTEKDEKYLSEGKKLGSTCLPTCSPASFMSIKEFSMWVCWKVFSTNQAVQFISHGVSCSYFSGDFLLPFLLWYDFKILVKSRGGGTFLCLAPSVNIRRSNLFFNWKLNIPFFIFLIWMEQFWIWVSQKLTKNVEISIAF